MKLAVDANRCEMSVDSLPNTTVRERSKAKIAVVKKTAIIASRRIPFLCKTEPNPKAIARNCRIGM